MRSKQLIGFRVDSSIIAKLKKEAHWQRTSFQALMEPVIIEFAKTLKGYQKEPQPEAKTENQPERQDQTKNAIDIIMSAGMVSRELEITEELFDTYLRLVDYGLIVYDQMVMDSEIPTMSLIVLTDKGLDFYLKMIK